MSELGFELYSNWVLLKLNRVIKLRLVDLMYISSWISIVLGWTSHIGSRRLSTLLRMTKLAKMSFLVTVKAFFAICLTFFGRLTGSTIWTSTRLFRLRPAMTPMASTTSAFVFRPTTLMYGIHLLYCLHGLQVLFGNLFRMHCTFTYMNHPQHVSKAGNISEFLNQCSLTLVFWLWVRYKNFTISSLFVKLQHCSVCDRIQIGFWRLHYKLNLRHTKTGKCCV